MKIKNLEKLRSQGEGTARKIVLEILESSLQALDSYEVIRRLLILDGDTLKIGDCQWDLAHKRRLFVVGAGKAGNAMAKAVEERLGDWISDGLVIVKQLDPGERLHRIQWARGGHPLPNEEGLKASKRILNLVEQSTADDLFITVISGGSSALMNCPVPGIIWEEEVELTEELLKCGARILEINAIRRHISMTNGGRLAQKIEARGAEMINLIVSDSVGGKPTGNAAQPTPFWGTPVAPDATTLGDARAVMKKYDLYSRIPRSIVDYLGADDPARETPKAFSDSVRHFVIGRPADACEAAKQASEKMGLPGFVLTTLLEGESREAGIFLASIAKEVALNHRPLSPPCVLIAGGETTTQIEGGAGLGGPSQELALGFALEVSGQTGLAIGAIDTDGTDGPTEIAGGVGDGTTVERSRQKGLDVYEILRRHDSSNLLRTLGDEIMTGNTGTNVCDLNIVYVSS